MKNTRHKRTYIFYVIALFFLGVSIGFDYLKLKTIEANYRFTIGYVVEYKSFSNSSNNFIKYTYSVNGKKYEKKFRDSSLSSSLKGKRVLIKYSNTFKFLNYPVLDIIVPDNLEAPEEGWTESPL